MRVGIDSYSYHRLLGQVRPGEEAPVALFEHGTLSAIAEADDAGADFLSLETMFLGPLESIDAAALRDAAGAMELGLSWGGMHGLEFGRNEAAGADLLRWLEFAPELGCRRVRIVAASPKFRGAEPIDAQIRRTVPVLRDACDVARAYDVELALENHGDLRAAEIEDLLERVGDTVLGVCFDTANASRVGDDLIDAVRRLAPVIRMLHLKDCVAEYTDPIAGPVSVAYGAGVLPLGAVLQELDAAGFDDPVCVELAQLAPDADERALVRECVRWLRAH